MRRRHLEDGEDPEVDLAHVGRHDARELPPGPLEELVRGVVHALRIEARPVRCKAPEGGEEGGPGNQVAGVRLLNQITRKQYIAADGHSSAPQSCPLGGLLVWCFSLEWLYPAHGETHSSLLPREDRMGRSREGGQRGGGGGGRGRERGWEGEEGERATGMQQRTGRTVVLVIPEAALFVGAPHAAAELVDAWGCRQARAGVAVELVALVVLGAVEHLGRGEGGGEGRGEGSEGKGREGGKGGHGVEGVAHQPPAEPHTFPLLCIPYLEDDPGPPLQSGGLEVQVDGVFPDRQLVFVLRGPRWLRFTLWDPGRMVQTRAALELWRGTWREGCGWRLGFGSEGWGTRRRVEEGAVEGRHEGAGGVKGGRGGRDRRRKRKTSESESKDRRRVQGD